MSKLVKIISLIALFATSNVWADDTIDQIAAVVNSKIITASQLDAQLTISKQQLTQSGVAIPAADVLRKQVLQHMIDNEIQLQQADRVGIKVTDTDIDQAIDNIAQQNHLTTPQLEAKVVQQGLDLDQYRAEIGKEMTISRLQQAAVGPTISVSEQEIKDVMPTIEKQSRQPTASAGVGYDVLDILLTLPASPTAQQQAAATKTAQDVITQLRAGADLQKLLDANPNLTVADLGMRKLTDLPDLFESTVQQMKQGDIAGPITAPNGLHILRLVAVQGASDAGGNILAPIQQTHVRHILIKKNGFETDAHVQARLEQLRNDIVHGADFAQMAKDNSQDPGSAGKGGDLGWVSPGTLDPAFEGIMNKLSVGQLSEPVKSSFGWHLIQVLGRKDITDKQTIMRERARELVYQRKFQEAVTSWLQGLRSQSYIKVTE